MFSSRWTRQDLVLVPQTLLAKNPDSWLEKFLYYIKESEKDKSFQKTKFQKSFKKHLEQKDNFETEVEAIKRNTTENKKARLRYLVLTH